MADGTAPDHSILKVRVLEEVLLLVAGATPTGIGKKTTANQPADGVRGGGGHPGQLWQGPPFLQHLLPVEDQVGGLQMCLSSHFVWFGFEFHVWVFPNFCNQIPLF